MECIESESRWRSYSIKFDLLAFLMILSHLFSFIKLLVCLSCIIAIIAMTEHYPFLAIHIYTVDNQILIWFDSGGLS